MATTVHPRHGFWYKVGFVFAAILLATLIAFTVVAATGTRLQPNSAVLLGDALVSSFFLAVLSFLIDSIRFRRTGWIIVDGILTIIAVYLIIRFSR